VRVQPIFLVHENARDRYTRELSRYEHYHAMNEFYREFIRERCPAT
jgi:hypothetical protein